MLARIRERSGISVEEYMGRCNAHYYATRDPLGLAGDFTTAPEISQMFGEMLGAALADCWMRAGAPTDSIYVELGPGRGTLAADAVRVLRQGGFAGAVHLVETSPMLRAEQAQRIPEAEWHDSLDTLPPAPLLLVANEFFDALPIRQFVGTDERRVAIAGEALAFTLDGAIEERSPARDAAARDVGTRLDASGGVALIVDYGHARSAIGDTLQAVSRHRRADPLANPGEQDLTAHVDFEALGQAAGIGDVALAGLEPQGHWLDRLGIVARATALAQRHPDRADEFAAAVHRLCDPDQMGSLFKVMGLHSRHWPPPAGFEP